MDQINMWMHRVEEIIINKVNLKMLNIYKSSVAQQEIKIS